MSKIINVCGFPRSGTTLLAYKLNQLKNIAAIPEAQFRFIDKLNSNSNFIDRIRNNRRLKKSFKSWEELSINHFSFNFKQGKFVDISQAFLKSFHQEKFDFKFIVDHTPENLFGFDELSDYSNQSFIFINRSITSLVKSHSKLKWSNMPPIFLAAKHAIYNAYIARLKEFLDEINHLDYATIDYVNLIDDNWQKSLKFPSLDTELEKTIKNKSEIKSFPLPSYTKKQHSYLDKDVSQIFKPLEFKNKKNTLSFLRNSYMKLTLPGIIKSYLIK